MEDVFLGIVCREEGFVVSSLKTKRKASSGKQSLPEDSRTPAFSGLRPGEIRGPSEGSSASADERDDPMLATLLVHAAYTHGVTRDLSSTVAV